MSYRNIFRTALKPLIIFVFSQNAPSYMFNRVLNTPQSFDGWLMISIAQKGFEQKYINKNKKIMTKILTKHSSGFLRISMELVEKCTPILKRLFNQ